MLTIRQMRYFDALATTRHFGRAAALVHVSQPALSAQIAELEKHLGVTLVERGRKGTLLTAEGDRVLARIRDILKDIEALEASTARAAEPLTQTLRVGIIPTVAPYLVPVLIPHLRAHHPRLHLELREAVTAALIEDLRLGQLDLVIAALPVEADGLQASFLFRDRFLIACGDNEEAILDSPMSQEDVDINRLLLLEEGHCMREQALAVCQAGSGRRIVNYGATSMTTLIEMVTHGLGLTLIPEIAVQAESQRPTLRILPFADPQPAREIGLISRSSTNRNGDFEAFAAAVRASAGQLLPHRDPDGGQATASRRAK